MELIDDIQYFYIFFHNKIETKWWNIFLDENFCHCSVVEKKTYGNINVYIEMANFDNLIKSDVYFGEWGDEIFTKILKLKNVTCLEYKIKITGNKKFISFFKINCVTFVKKVIEINNYFVFTPKQLYNYLLKTGARKI